MRNETDTRDARYTAAENTLRAALQRATAQARVNPEPTRVVRTVATVATPEPIPAEPVVVVEPVIVATIPATVEPVRATVAQPVVTRPAFQRPAFQRTERAEITFTKLRNGDWGLRGPESMLRGAQWVTVTRRGGDTTRVQVARIVWTGNGVAVASIQR